MVKNNSKHKAFESKTGDGSLALRVENFQPRTFSALRITWDFMESIPFERAL
jgi:hypothetical protein